MTKILKRMNSLTEKRNRYFSVAIMLLIVGIGALLYDVRLGIIIATFSFIVAAVYFKKGKIWGAGAVGELSVLDVLRTIPGEVYIIPTLTA
ncbi:MAG: hypothetical protein Q8N36_04995 [bacterium]|nr:hypothetical protein [bacterium]